MDRLRTLSQLWAPFTRGRSSLYAAGAGFYLLLSMIPASVFFWGMLAFFPGARDAAIDVLSKLIPSPITPFLQTLRQELAAKPTPVVLSLSALTTLWSASRGVQALMDGFRGLLGIPDHRNYLQRKLRAIAQFLLFSICLSAVLFLLILGRHFFRQIPFLASMLPLWIGLLLLYAALPDTQLPFRYLLLGSSLVILAWSVGTSLFGLYIDRISDLQGSIGFLVLFLLWLHVCMMLVLYGGILAKILSDGSWHPLKILKQALFPPCS